MQTASRHPRLTMRRRLGTALAYGLRAAAAAWWAAASPSTAAPSAGSTGSGRTSAEGPSPGRTSTPGTPTMAGQIRYEIDDSLQGARLALECDRMMRQAAKAAMVHNRLLDAACSSGLRWVPGCGSANAERNARHMNADFGLGSFKSGWLRTPIDEVRRRTIGYAGCGFGYGEVAVDRGSDGLWHVVDIYDCCPTAHAANGWVPGPNGELTRILQASMYGQTGYIDADWAILWSFNRTGTNYEGRGLLRPCLPWFKMVGLAYEMLGIATEKYAVGVPKGHIDRSQANGLYEADFDEMIDRFIEVMEQYAVGEKAYLLDSPAFKTEIFGQDAFNPERIVSVIKFALDQILSAYLLNMLELGTSASKYGVGQVLQDAFTQLVVRVLDTWCSPFSGRLRPGGGAVLRVLELSYGPQHPNDLPKFEHFGVADDPFADLVPHLPHLLNPLIQLARYPVLWDRLMQLSGIDPEKGRETLALLSEVTPPEGAGQPSAKNLDPSSGGVPRKVAG